MLHGDTGPFEEAIKAAGGRLDRKVGGWRFPLAREGEIRELFGIPLGAETVPGDNFVSEVPEASPEVLRETPLPVSGDMAMSGQTGLEVTHGGLQQGTPGAGTGELLSESVPVDAAGNPGELAAAEEDPDDTMGIWEIDLIWIRLYLELMAERPDLEPLFNEPRDLSRFPEKGGARMCPSTRFLRFLTREDLLLDEEMSQHFEDCQKWDAMYPEEAKERKMRRLRKMGGKE